MACQFLLVMSSAQLNVFSCSNLTPLLPPLWVSSLGASHLASMGTVQDKVTVCATNDSYQVTRERMTQAVEDTRERGTKVIKPGGKYRGRSLFYLFYRSSPLIHTQATHQDHPQLTGFLELTNSLCPQSFWKKYSEC